MLAASVCPSVCRSFTFMYCIQTPEDIVKLISLPDSPSLQFFFTPSADTQLQREPLQRAVKHRGVGGKICHVRLMSFILETVRHRPVVAMER